MSQVFNVAAEDLQMAIESEVHVPASWKLRPSHGNYEFLNFRRNGADEGEVTFHVTFNAANEFNINMSIYDKFGTQVNELDHTCANIGEVVKHLVTFVKSAIGA